MEYPTWLKLGLIVGIEYCWNVFPSTVFSSSLLLACHLVMLGGLLRIDMIDMGESGEKVVTKKNL
jgi:hypothetical protein